MSKVLKENILLLGLVGCLFLAVVLMYWLVNRDHTGPTGGMGQFDDNSVVIAGWDKMTSNQVEVGEIISPEQQKQLTQKLSQHLVNKYGQFNYKELTIQDDIENTYDKLSNRDTTEFSIKLNTDEQIYRAVLDHTTNEARLFVQSSQEEILIKK